MKYYKFKNAYSLQLNKVGLPFDTEEKIRILEDEKISENNYWENPKLVRFYLYSISEECMHIMDEEQPSFLDFHRWRGSYLYNPPLHGSPEFCSVCIISPAIQKILETFCIPTHYFYPIEVYNPHTKTGKPYFIFHILGDLYTELNYSETVFIEHTLSPEKVIRKLEKGLIKNYEDFTETSQNVYKKNGHYISPKTMVYKEHYDILPAIIFNEKVKNALEKENLVGVEFKEYNNFSFITGV